MGIISIFGRKTKPKDLIMPYDKNMKKYVALSKKKIKIKIYFTGWLNTIYFGHYLIGRIISIPLSTIIPPSVIISISILGCLLSTTILVSFGTYNTYALFIGKNHEMPKVKNMNS